MQKTDDYFLKRRISYALDKIGDSKAVNFLIDLLQKTDNNDLKERILDALDKIGDQAVDPLINLLKKTDDNLKWIISDLFVKSLT